MKPKKTEMCFYQSYLSDETNQLENCTCGKCAKALKPKRMVAHGTTTHPVGEECEVCTRVQDELKNFWAFKATKEELENCICSDYDGKGVSCCGFPCPVHTKAKKTSDTRDIPANWKRQANSLQKLNKNTVVVVNGGDEVDNFQTKAKKTSWRTCTLRKSISAFLADYVRGQMLKNIEASIDTLVVYALAEVRQEAKQEGIEEAIHKIRNGFISENTIGSHTIDVFNEIIATLKKKEGIE